MCKFSINTIEAESTIRVALEMPCRPFGPILGLLLLLGLANAFCPPSTPTNYDERNGKYYIGYSNQKNFNQAKNACPPGYHLMEWRNQLDLETAAHYMKVFDDNLWTGLWNGNTHSCYDGDCENKFVWLRDDSVQDFHPIASMRGMTNRPCLFMIMAATELRIVAKHCSQKKASYVCEAFCTIDVTPTLTCPPDVPSERIMRNGKYYLVITDEFRTYNLAKSTSPYGCPSGKLFSV